MKQNIIWIFTLMVSGLSIPFLFNACGQAPQNSPPPGNSEQHMAATEFYFSKMTRLEVEIAYEPGAEPYTGTTNNGTNYWSILEKNLEAVFTGRSVTFGIPKNLSEMQQLPALNKNLWSASDALALAQQYRKADSDSSTGRFFIAFVNGHANDNGSANTNTIAFSVTGSTVILVFKDVIRATGSTPAAIVPKYVEQSTLVHEMGHALGFVNNGLPLTSAHHDSAHGAHCANPNCVMYYLNEGKSDMIQFVQKFISTGSLVMFDQSCLADSQNYRP